MNIVPFCLAVKRDIAFTFLLSCMCVHCARVHASVQICPGHNSYMSQWISILFDTVVVLGEEKCHLKHFFRLVEGQGHT